jgi:hypothetical protein
LVLFPWRVIKSCNYSPQLSAVSYSCALHFSYVQASRRLE